MVWKITFTTLDDLPRLLLFLLRMCVTYVMRAKPMVSTVEGKPDNSQIIQKREKCTKTVGGITVDVLKFRTLSFCNQMLVIMTGTHKMLVRIANGRDPSVLHSLEVV